jgi:putative tryptophan/tyrosine transport system substrate-binding protein
MQGHIENATAGVHRRDWERRGIATRGTRAAARTDAARGRVDGPRRNRPRGRGSAVGLHAGACRAGLDRRSHGADRCSLGRWQRGPARIYAKELVELQPDVILADSTPEAAELHRETRTIPIVFVLVADPIGAGFVAGLPRPGGNMTGFIPNEPALTSKWLELLTQIAPGVKRVTVIFNPDSSPYVESVYLPQFEAAAPSFKVAPITAQVRSDAEIETAITSLGSEPGGGLIVLPGVFMNDHRTTTISLAARHNIPAVYPHSDYVRDGGLVSYGPELGDFFHRAAAYVDRILRGAKPVELPVQLPVKFVMALNTSQKYLKFQLLRAACSNFCVGYPRMALVPPVLPST